MVDWLSGRFADSGGYELPVVPAGGSIALAFPSAGRFSLNRTVGWYLRGVERGVPAILLAALSTAAVISSRIFAAALLGGRPTTTA